MKQITNIINNELFYINSCLPGTRTSLFSVANWKNGAAFKKTDFSEKGWPIIKIAELNNGITNNTAYTNKIYDESIHLRYGDLLFSWSGNPQTSIDIYKCRFQDGWLNQHIFKVVPDSNFIDKDFFFYIMKYLKPNFTKIATNKQTTGLGHVTIADIKRISFILPPLPIQKKIAAVLSALDDKIELNNKINQNLEQQAQALFDNYFRNITSGSSTIGQYLIPKRGKNLLSKDAIQGNVPVVAGGLLPSTYHNVANTSAPVITISASGANAGYVNLWHIPVWSSDSSFIDSAMTNNVYFWFVLLKKRQKEIFDAQTGSAQAHIYPQHIANLSITELNIDLIINYNAVVTPLFRIIAHNLTENLRLAQLRDALLPKLMSGEVDVSKVNIDDFENKILGEKHD